MSKEELLNPRIKVINEDTSGNLKKGEVIPLADETGLYWVNGEPMGQEKIDRFPHLFRPLQWWEEREDKDLPIYVRFEINYRQWVIGDVEKVFNWHRRPRACIFHNHVHAANLSPATEQDYINSKSTKP